MDYLIHPLLDESYKAAQLQHSTEFSEKQNSAIVRQTCMTKGDFYISG
jgi:hypothetical protein